MTGTGKDLGGNRVARAQVGPPETGLSERISQLVSDAPSLSGDDFAIKALPLLMEANDRLHVLEANAEGLRDERNIGRESAAANSRLLSEAQARIAELTQALERIASVPCQIACASLPNMTRCVTCIAREALGAGSG